VRLAALLAVATLACGCGGGSGAEDGGRSQVVAAFYPLAYAAERIGGDTVSVTNLTPPGAEPHDVELSARDVERIRDADVVLYLGGGFQPAVARAARDSDATVVDLLTGLPLRRPDEHEEEHEGEDHGGDEVADPHVWLDATLYSRIVARVGEQLDRSDAAEALVRELRQLDSEYRQRLGDCARRELVTSHAAFGYLAARYDLEQIAIAGLSPEAEPTPRELEHVVEEVREAGATTIFFETLASPRVAETVARETGARTAVLNPVEGLTEQEVAAGATYFTIMRANLETLRSALGCR
jgi:zinc transport system substrate-binding protein